MSYIGNSPTSVAFLTDLFSGNGSTTAFTMSVAPAGTTSILVAVTGVVQSPDTYSVVGTTLTFSAAPPSGTGNISVRYLGIPASGVTTTAYRTVTEFTATAGQTTFTPPSYTVGYIDVYRNGVRLGAADYTASNGTTVVLTAAATAGDLVSTVSFYVSSVLNAIPATAGAVNSSYIANGAVGAAQLAQSRILTSIQQPAGSVLQVLSTTKLDGFSTASTSFVDITGLSVSITPTSTTSKILVITSVTCANSVGNAFIQVVRNSTAIAICTGGTSGTYQSMTMNYPSSYNNLSYSVQYLDSPATTSATTYKMQCRSETNTMYVNLRSSDNAYGSVSSITVMEIAA